MHRIDTIGATPDNMFKTAPAPATVVGPDWLTAVQEEIANVITLMGLAALDKANNAQLANAIFVYVTRRLGQVRRLIQHPSGGNEAVDEDDIDQLVVAVQRMVGLGVASTKGFVERVITDPQGGNSGLDYDSPQQLLTVIRNLISAAVGGAKRYTDRVITDPAGGDTALDYDSAGQLLAAIQRMVGIGVGSTKAYVERVITDPDGGNAGLDYNSPGQLLAAIQRMIGLAFASSFSFSATLPGHFALPGGALIQFGRATANANGSTTVMLPIAYDVLFAGVWVNGTDDNSLDAQDNWPTAKVPTQNDRFVIRNANDNADTVQWIAFGFRSV